MASLLSLMRLPWSISRWPTYCNVSARGLYNLKNNRMWFLGRGGGCRATVIMCCCCCCCTCTTSPPDTARAGKSSWPCCMGTAPAPAPALGLASAKAAASSSDTTSRNSLRSDDAAGVLVVFSRICAIVCDSSSGCNNRLGRKVWFCRLAHSQYLCRHTGTPNSVATRRLNSTNGVCFTTWIGLHFSWSTRSKKISDPICFTLSSAVASLTTM
mmetsp:Transcript_16836/g.41373  ORF Transcript_16836/g.41373 Transcript_16836/m.41373 type:complete len:213 (-) Transcript_16836:1765-2403(-)